MINYINEFYDGNLVVSRVEGDEIAQFALNNPDLKFLSTLEIGKDNICSFPNCSLYFYIENNKNINYE